MCCELHWNLPNKDPINETAVIVENLNEIMYADFIGPNFYSWGDDIVRWAYFPDETNEIYAKYKNALRVKHYKEENEKLKKDVEDWHNKYLDLLGKQHNEHQRDAFVGKRSKFAIDDYCGSVNSDGDEHLTADDLCELFKPDDARPVGEISIDEIGDIFHKVMRIMREGEERKRIEEDDGK